MAFSACSICPRKRKLIIVWKPDVITIAVPPALPATLSIGTSFALSRLRKKQIYCISPQRVNVGGKLDIMCFDKTGTLTEDGLDILGVRVAAKGRFNDLIDHVSSLYRAAHIDRQSNFAAILHTMATCHSLRSVDDELVGDPLDLKMMEFTGWSFEEGKHSVEHQDEDEQGGLCPSIARPTAEFVDSIREDCGSEVGEIVGLALPDLITQHWLTLGQPPIELGVLRGFEFVSQLRRASVVVRQFGQQSGDIFVKGAPECMRDICREDTCKSCPSIEDGGTHRPDRV